MSTDFNNFGNIGNSVIPAAGIPSGNNGGGAARGFKIGAALFAIMIFGALFYWFFLFDYFNPMAIKGSLVDAVYVPGADATSGRLLFETDDSFYYTNQTSTGNSFSMSTESLFNKTYFYIYDPVSKTVLQKTKTEYPSTPPHPKMFYLNQKVWMIAEGNDEHPPLVQTVDPVNAGITMNTEAFYAKYPPLKVGVAELRMDNFPKRLNIKTRDGLEYVYNIETDTFSTRKEFDDAKRASDDASTDTTSVFALAGQNDRNMLYRLTGPRSKLEGQTFSSGELDNPDTVKFFYDATSTPLTPDKAYLLGSIVYQDKDVAVIFHQAQIGKDSGRLLTCVDSTGKVLWSLGQDQLFPELALRSDDAFSDMFFILDKVSAVREGDLLIFRMEDVGIMAIDVNTGEKKWTFTS